MKTQFTSILLILIQGCGMSSYRLQDTGPFSCDLKSETLKLTNATVTLPGTGKFVEESHLASAEDTFSEGRLFPSSETERIEKHLDRSCVLLKQMFFSELRDCDLVYEKSWQRVWTPSENGLAGQGSVGNLRPSALQEMWLGNMYWTSQSKPKPGERWLISFEGKHVVLAMGFESGPGDVKYLGGYQSETRYALGSNNNSEVQIGRLLDQSLPYGPVSCLSD